MHPDLRAMYRAVAENPADDLPRLVMADWMDEHGMAERADYVRRAIVLANTKHNHRHKEFGGEDDGCPACKIRRELIPYEKFLRTPEGRTEKLWGPGWWTPGFAPSARDLTTAMWSRGFMFELQIDLPDLVKHARTILLGTPVEKLEMVFEEHINERLVRLPDRTTLPMDSRRGEYLAFYSSYRSTVLVIRSRPTTSYPLVMFTRGVRTEMSNMLSWSTILRGHSLSTFDSMSAAEGVAEPPIYIETAHPVLKLTLGRRTCPRYGPDPPPRPKNRPDPRTAAGPRFRPR